MKIVSPALYARNPQAAEQVRLGMIRWCQARIRPPCRFSPGANALGLVNRDHLVAVVVFDCMTDWNCEISIATDGSKRWASRRLIKAIADYVFLQCRLERATAYVSADNSASILLCEKLGFRREGRLRRAPGHPDVVVFGVLPSDVARFLPGERYALVA